MTPGFWNRLVPSMASFKNEWADPFKGPFTGTQIRDWDSFGLSCLNLRFLLWALFLIWIIHMYVYIGTYIYICIEVDSGPY